MLRAFLLACATLGPTASVNAQPVPKEWKADAEDVFSLEAYFGAALGIRFDRGFAAASPELLVMPRAGAYFFKANAKPSKTAAQCVEAIRQRLRKLDHGEREAWLLGARASRDDSLPADCYSYSLSRTHSLFSEGLSVRLLMRVNENDLVVDFCLIVFQPSEIKKLEPMLYTLINNHWATQRDAP